MKKELNGSGCWMRDVTHTLVGHGTPVGHGTIDVHVLALG